MTFHVCCIYILIVYTTYDCSRCSPNEWDNPHPCNDDCDEVEIDFNLHGCFWHNWGSLMQQGSDICPRYNCTAASVNANFIVPIKYILKWDILSFFTHSIYNDMTNDGLSFRAPEDYMMEQFVKEGKHYALIVRTEYIDPGWVNEENGKTKKWCAPILRVEVLATQGRKYLNSGISKPCKKNMYYKIHVVT